MRPLITYYGGKQRLASKLVPLIPPHAVYVEPFCGGATLLYAKPEPMVSNACHYREVINDTSQDLVNMYRQARHNPQEFFRRIELTPYSKADHDNACAILARKIDADDMTLAWAYYVSINTSFAHELNAGWGRSLFGENKASSWWSRRALDAHIKRLKGVHIECSDALECIRQWDCPQTFFYCDPPYPGTSQGHYKGYTHDDFQNLLNALALAQGAWMLSCYDVPGIEMPQGVTKYAFAATCSASGKGKTGKNRDKTRAANDSELGNCKRTEVVYTRPCQAPWRSELAKLRDAGKYACFTGGMADAQLAMAI